MIKKLIMKNRFLAAIITIYVALLIIKTEVAFSALSSSLYYLVEMIQILPVVFLLIVAIDVLVPRDWIIKRLGMKSGIRGSLLALVFGSISAGPVYAAFPIAKMLLEKGASVGNIVIILSAWAVIKVPMLANEVKFIGPEFMGIRWIFTVIAIFSIAWIIERLKISVELPVNKTDRMYVDSKLCVSCGVCYGEAPDMFFSNDGKAEYHGKLHDERIFSDMMKKCPVGAIKK